jgi:hypothetical protein
MTQAGNTEQEKLSSIQKKGAKIYSILQWHLYFKAGDNRKLKSSVFCSYLGLSVIFDEDNRQPCCDWDDNGWLRLRVKRLDDDVGDVRKRRIGSVWNGEHWRDQADLILGFSCFFQMTLSIVLFLSFLSFSSDYILSFLHHLVPCQPQLSCCLVSKLLNISVA